ncbi:MAG TPA: radical SAM protein [Longimicrobiales bacterium]
MMNTAERIRRHARITMKNYGELPSPPFLVLFINSVCNMKCDHCFYWRALNQKNDLTKEEIFELSRSLGQIENLNLSGGEPFIRKEFSEICRQFITHNGVRQIYVPTNGYFTAKTIKAIEGVLEEPSLDLFVAEISLDGMPEFHDTFRVTKNAFAKAMETYDALAELQKKDPRLRIHCISTATDVNMEEIKQLTTFLYDRCPQMDHHNLAIIRGDRKNPTLQGPSLKQYEDLYEYIRQLWSPREVGRYGAIVEPMLQWAKVKTIKEQRQVVPCKAGRISAVVYANGDVSVCEMHKPLGNLREKPFWEIWGSPEANALRESIARKDCFCTTEVFMWSSITYQPTQLVKAMVGGKVWQRAKPLPEDQRVQYPPLPVLNGGGNGAAADEEPDAVPAGPALVQLRPEAQ